MEPKSSFARSSCVGKESARGSQGNLNFQSFYHGGLHRGPWLELASEHGTYCISCQPQDTVLTLPSLQDIIFPLNGKHTRIIAGEYF
jgi:hypothetical protein